jgi:hypothetical protein
LKYLIEIVLSKDKIITINPFILDLIDSEIKEEKPKDFRDWKHEISPDIKKVELFIN